MKFTSALTFLLGAAGVFASPIPTEDEFDLVARTDHTQAVEAILKPRTADAAPLAKGFALAAPPGIPSASTARSQLNSLTVAAPGSMSGYNRDLFRHWVNVQGNCDAREMVLRRDGTGVNVNNACQPTSGSWYSPYDGQTVTSSSSVDIDHMVPLANAWISGASSWSASRREAFANDLSIPQLWAVSATSNRSKGDRSPDQWAPPRSAFRCTYARSWIRVKSAYNLRITSAEKSALSSMLNTC